MTDESKSNTEVNETDGFKFAVTIIVAFSSIGFNIYNYIKNNPVNLPYSLIFICLSLVAYTFYIVLHFLAYIVVKGSSLETNDPITKEKLENLSSSIYSRTFNMALDFSITIFIVSILFKVYNLEEYIGIYADLLTIVVTWMILIWVLHIKNYIKYYIKECIKIIKMYMSKGISWKILRVWNILQITNLVFDIVVDKLHPEDKFIFYRNKSMIVTAINSTLVISLLTLIVNSFTDPYIIDNLSYYIIAPQVYNHLLILCLYLQGKLSLVIHKSFVNSSPIVSSLSTLEHSKTKVDPVVNMTIFSFFFDVVLLISFVFIFSYFFIGDIRVTMDDVNSIDDTPIPVQIITTGYCSNLTIDLTKTSIKGEELILEDSITVHPQSNNNEILFNKSLYSNTLNYGKYMIFINTTNLTPGYYELSCCEDFTSTYDSLSILSLSNMFGLNPTKKAYSSFYLAKAVNETL